jgi:hypothetical protein
MMEPPAGDILKQMLEQGARNAERDDNSSGRDVLQKKRSRE